MITLTPINSLHSLEGEPGLRRLILRPEADTSHESPEDWYDSYGAHASCERHGDIAHPVVSYAPTEQELEEITRSTCRDCRDAIQEMLERADDIRDAAHIVCGLLDEAVRAYRDGDLQACVGTLLGASAAESEHGDDPATDALARQLLAFAERPPTVRGALRRGDLVSVPYHMEGYGPGRLCLMWGAAQVGEASGPDGYLRVGVDDGHLIIDEWDDEVCPRELHGHRIGDGTAGGRLIVADDTP